MAGSGALMATPSPGQSAWAHHPWPHPASLDSLLARVGHADQSAARAAFGACEGQAWLFDLETDPGEQHNLLLLPGASSAAPPADGRIIQGNCEKDT